MANADILFPQINKVSTQYQTHSIIIFNLRPKQSSF